MEIIIHRGTHQIGGCATEIKTEKSRILIDFGAELDIENAKELNIDGVTTGETNCNAVFFSHYHGDHMGLIDTLNSDIPLYIGEPSKEILKILNDRLASSSRVVSHNQRRLDGVLTFKDGKKIRIGDITVTPYRIDHSAYDAHMFLIEADGKRVLHTGDFRTHGFTGKGVSKVLKNLVGHVDAVICEGTTLNRTESTYPTENEIKHQINDVLENNRYVFMICSSTNIDRIAGICSARPRGKYLLCDDYQYDIIEYIREATKEYNNLYQCNGILTYGKNLDEKMIKQGFCMLVRAGNPNHKELIDKFKEYDPVIIYSMWKGYLDEESVKNFVDGYTRYDIHTSGHASRDAIKMLLEETTPNIIIPIHTEVPDAFVGIYDDAKVILPNDGEIIKI